MLGTIRAVAWPGRFTGSRLRGSAGPRFLLIAVVAFVGAFAGLHAFFVESVHSTVWYPLAGVTAAIAARQIGSRAPLVLGVLVGTALAGAAMTWSPAVWLGYGLANAVEVLVFAAVHARLHRGRRPLERTTDVVRMGLTSVIAVTAGAATFALPFLLIVVARDPSQVGIVVPGTRGYWASHLTGILVMGPALLALRAERVTVAGRRLETLLQLSATASTCPPRSWS
jgi:hypothetical protein